MNFKFWTWHHNSQLRRQSDFYAQHEAFIEALTKSLRHAQIAISQNVHVTHAQRPPPPRPIRITVCYEMTNGEEYKTFIPLNGSAYWVENMPHYVQQNAQNVRSIRYYLGYADGGML